MISFRDPPPVEIEADVLALSIARILVRAPSLPVDLPAYDLTLLGVESDGKAIDLVIGKSAPIAKIHLRRPGASAPIALGKGRARVIQGSVVEVHPDTRRFARALETMAERIAVATDAGRWEEAIGAGKKLHALPAHLPLEHFRQLVAGVGKPLGLVRTGFGCNQDCGLCWQGRDWGRYDAAQVLLWIEDLYRGGARSLIISGGEPTLDAELPRYLGRARELGFQTITLETNAVQMAKAGVAERLRDAGLTDCFVSLHSGDAEVSDAITRAPGTFVRTVKGVQNLLAAGVPVGLNCVMSKEGLLHLAGLPELIHEAFGTHPKLTGLMLSLPTDPFDRSLIPAIIPDPVKLRSILPSIIDRAFALGIEVKAIDGPCGPPLCAFGADLRITSLAPTPGQVAFREHLPACDRCVVKHACFGARTAQLELYGESCVEPILRLPTARAQAG